MIFFAVYIYMEQTNQDQLLTSTINEVMETMHDAVAELQSGNANIEVGDHRLNGDVLSVSLNVSIRCLECSSNGSLDPFRAQIGGFIRKKNQPILESLINYDKYN